MLRIWHGARGDALIMLVTFFGTIFLPIQFAVLSGILMSLAYYILKTSSPRVHEVLPDDEVSSIWSTSPKSRPARSWASWRFWAICTLARSTTWRRRSAVQGGTP